VGSRVAPSPNCDTGPKPPVPNRTYKAYTVSRRYTDQLLEISFKTPIGPFVLSQATSLMASQRSAAGPPSPPTLEDASRALTRTSSPAPPRASSQSLNPAALPTNAAANQATKLAKINDALYLLADKNNPHTATLQAL
jgi:hypothetical protein